MGFGDVWESWRLFAYSLLGLEYISGQSRGIKISRWSAQHILIEYLSTDAPGFLRDSEGFSLAKWVIALLGAGQVDIGEWLIAVFNRGRTAASQCESVVCALLFLFGLKRGRA